MLRPLLFLGSLLALAPACSKKSASAPARDAGAPPADVAPPPLSAAEVAARQALFEASWGVRDYERPVTELYAALEAPHLFTGVGGLTAPGRELVALLDGIAEHGLDPRSFGGAKLVDRARAFDAGPVEARARAELEVALASAFAFALDHLGGLLTLDAERRIDWAKNRWRERTIRYVAIAAEVRRAGTLKPLLTRLIPDDEGYRAMQAGLAHYRELAAPGPFPPGPSVARPERRWLRRGKAGRKVRQLTERLGAEGFHPGPPGDTFDEGVELAVIAFQRAHGMTLDGVVGPGTARRMRQGPAAKVTQIRVALRRTREAPSRASTTHVVVNVPEFRLRLIEAGREVLGMNVIVGDETEKEDEETGAKTRPNATRLFSAEIKHLVWNPSWQVPDRIKREELDFHLLDNPNWYAEHGYDLEVDEAGKERAIQFPGPENALGRVKLLFPNDWNIYLHDTPQRGLFARGGRRAYSHGCMRMEKPMVLARLLLEAGGQWDAEAVRKLMEEPVLDEEHPLGLYERRWVNLKRPLPIHIEHRTVVGDAEGVRFLEDLYAYDQPYAERLEREDRRLSQP